MNTKSKLLWHPNNSRKLEDYKPYSKKKGLWQCGLFKDHQCVASIAEITNCGNCPFCSNKRIVNSNCFNTTHPNKAKLWHPTMNGDLTPFMVTYGSNKYAWWQCDLFEDHQWKTKIAKVATGTGCPFCAGRKIANSNCLNTTHPDLCKEWHATKNGNLTPFIVGAGQHIYAWWQCVKGHEWRCTVENRTRGKLGGTKCPYCLNQKISIENSLIATNPEWVKEWHVKNHIKPSEISCGSNKKVWWQCQRDNEHVWFTSPGNRKGCPFCANREICSNNSLAIKFPELCKEWHPTKNLPLLPSMVTPGAGHDIWWQCKNFENHVWIAPPCRRTGKRKSGCPFCNESKGESKIAEYFDRLGLEYIRQATFPDCKNKMVLRYDFMINVNNNIVLIEYNGKQHYFELEYFGGKDNLLKVQENDKIKKDYCSKNNIKLIIIPYNQFNKIDSILEEKCLNIS